MFTTMIQRPFDSVIKVTVT